jgi:hypothetical protein
MSEFEFLPDEALVPVELLCAPAGPVPYRRSWFLELVRFREAPAPAVKGRQYYWRVSDIREWLEARKSEFKQRP